MCRILSVFGKDNFQVENLSFCPSIILVEGDIPILRFLKYCLYAFLEVLFLNMVLYSLVSTFGSTSVRKGFVSVDSKFCFGVVTLAFLV